MLEERIKELEKQLAQIKKAAVAMMGQRDYFDKLSGEKMCVGLPVTIQMKRDVERALELLALANHAMGVSSWQDPEVELLPWMRSYNEEMGKV